MKLFVVSSVRESIARDIRRNIVDFWSESESQEFYETLSNRMVFNMVEGFLSVTASRFKLREMVTFCPNDIDDFDVYIQVFFVIVFIS